MEIHTPDQMFNCKDANPREISKALKNKFVWAQGVNGSNLWIRTEDILYIRQDG